MSLTKQLWIAIVLITLLSLGGSLVVSTLSARQYLQQELEIKNVDNATSLALSLSQMPKDPVMVEMQIAAQFDAGHYQLIRLVAPDGTVLVERRYAGAGSEVPAWFARLVPIETHPGIAQVQDGWHQFGTLTVETHSRYAYASLWRATWQLLAWIIGGGLVCGLIGTTVLRRITRPLDSMVAQAEAIGGRRFVTTEEPRTLEFRSVVRALNALSERVRTMLADESKRLEQLRRQAQYDELTGLFNRGQFLNQVDDALARDDAHAGGALFIARVTGLAELNQRLGRAATDALLARLAQTLQQVAAGREHCQCGRLNASDFAVLAAGELEPGVLADQLSGTLHAAFDEGGDTPAPRHLLTAMASYSAGDSRSQLLARADGALAFAEQGGDRGPAPATAAADAHRLLGATPDAWRQTLDAALTPGSIELAHYPVTARDGRLLHAEAPVRLKLDGQWQSAGLFLPFAARVGMLPRIDALVVDTACRLLDADPGMAGLAIKLSADAVRDAAFRTRLLDTLQAHPAAAGRLWVDVQESSALKHQVEFRALCLALRPLGCKVGLQHAGQDFSRFAELHELGLDYIKISTAFIRGIDGSPSNTAFVRGLCTIAHSIGLLAIAQGVSSTAERDTLSGLGIDAQTGPGIAP